MVKHILAEVSDLPIGSRRLFEVKGRPIVVFNIGGEFFGLLNRCPHQGGQLCAGRLIGVLESSEPGQYKYSRHGELLRCPWHGWEFDVRTGQSWCEPNRIKARSFTTDVQNGGNLVQGPYVAETVKIYAEREYIVVDL